MFCHECGTQIPEGVKFCYKCGAKVVEDINGNTANLNTTDIQTLEPSNIEMLENPNRSRIECPNCHSLNLIPVSETQTYVSGSGYGVGKGCCGYILLGPLGLLCGLCGTGATSQTTTSTWWVCKDCGNKFRDPKEIEAAKKTSWNLCLALAISFLVIFSLNFIAGIALYGEGGISVSSVLGMIISTAIMIFAWRMRLDDEKVKKINEKCGSLFKKLKGKLEGNEED